ncbi:MAG TPA: NADH-quinone oxidoreductase subunit NuoK [Candidatus Korarchaeota archaeon]|nr:NADH-quinone oxidoreductase subunit NuoK [Candidatus Korarchaeota archaeon]
MPTIYWYLSLSFVLAGIGLYGLITRRNLIRMLISVELMFNGALLTLLSLASTSAAYKPTGVVLALLAISLAAAEVGVVVSIAILMFRVKRSLDVFELTESRG